LGRGQVGPYDGSSARLPGPRRLACSASSGENTMAKSDKRPIIKLKSTAGTGYTYVTRKNKTNTRERIELKKYDPRIRQHVIFKEER
jgi:large subunit ribosomal protein L33